MPYQIIAIDFLEGLNQDQNPHSIEQRELTIAQNAARRATNLVGTRPGCISLSSGEDYENALTGTPAIQGAVEYRKNFDASRSLIVIANEATSKVWYEDAAQIPAGTPPTITTGTDNIWTFALHNNLLWAAGGASSDDIWTWDGDTGTGPVVRALTDKASTNRLRPQFIKHYRGYLVLNGLRGGTSNTNNPALSRYQDFGSDPTDDTNWKDSNTLGFSSQRVGSQAYGGTFTTGFGTYADNNGDFLLVLANDVIVSYILDQSGTTDFIRNDVIANGCVHQRAFVDLGIDAGDAIYMSRHGIHSLRQSQQFGARESSFLSRKIQQTFDSLNPNRLALTCAAYDRNNGRVVFAMSTGSSTTHDILMALDVRDPASINARDARWYGPWQITGISINHLLYARDANDTFRLYAFTTAGRVLRFAEDTFHDIDDQSYQVVIRTKDEAYGQVMLEKRIGDTVVHMQPGGNHSIQATTEFNYGNKSTGPVSVNQPDVAQSILPVTLPFTLGSGDISSDVKFYSTGRGRTIAQKFENNEADAAFFIGRIERQVSGAGEDTGAQTEVAA